MSNGSDIKRVALYTRVSTDEQAQEGFSLDSQLERLRSYCLAREWKISAEYVDPGFSGRNTRRPMYKKMFNEIDQWDGILVIKMDRIHRNRLNFIEMMNQIKKHEKEFISMSESLDTSTAMGRFVMGIIQDIAQLESEEIGERTFIAMKQKAKKKDSGFMGHSLAFGYKKENGKIVEVPEQLEIVRKTFELYIQGLSMTQIADKLGQKFGSIRYWLQNPWYAGYEGWLNHFKRAPVDPLISVELWNKIQLIKVSKPCGSAKHKPFLIEPGVDSFDIDLEEMKHICGYDHRPKHNFNY